MDRGVWMWVGVGLWLVLAFAAAVAVGRGIRIARDGHAADQPSVADEPRAAPVPRRRRIPLPPVGIGLAATGVMLVTGGFVARLTGATGPVASALSLDAPWSAPRAFVAVVFAVAAVAAVTGAAREPGRRSWWLAVGLVSGTIAVVEADDTVRAEAVSALTAATGGRGAVSVTVLLSGGVLAVLAVISRAERRDRRRVLGCLAGYAVASVGLSAVASALTGRWATTATYVEEAGEALAGVALFVAVLVGVAPRLALPASWLLRREDDVLLEAPRRLRGTARG